MPKAKQEKVFQLNSAARCYNCDKKLEIGSIISLQKGRDESEVLCLDCSGLSTYTICPKGNAKLTQLAGKHSSKSYVIMRWSDLWKCYERLGILVEAEALEKAREALNTNS